MSVSIGSEPLSRRQIENDVPALADLLTSSINQNLTRPALWTEQSYYSYAELYERASTLAAEVALADSGTRNSQCALLVDRGFTGYSAILASILAGVAYLPLNPHFPPARLGEILNLSCASSVIIDRESMVLAAGLLSNCPRGLHVLLPEIDETPAWASRMSRHSFHCRPEIEKNPQFPPRQCHDDRTGAYLLFTSGSTGTPKGILIRRSSVARYLKSVIARYHPNPDDRFSQTFDFSFDLSAHDMLLSWTSGACLYSVPHGAKMSPGNFIRRHELTFWFSVPSTAALMARMRLLRPGMFPSLRFSLFCGEALSTGLARKWQEAAPDSIVENLYGPTEATIAITAYRFSTKDDLHGETVVPIGWPFPDQNIAVIDETGRPVADGQAGELCLGGSQVADGYWFGNENKSGQFRAPLGASSALNWYRTGDLARLDNERGLIYLGRKDRQAKILGHRVELQEVENVMRSAARTETVAAIAWRASQTEVATSVVGFISGSRVSPSQIVSECTTKLPAYMVPKSITEVDKWPLNANGKTDYAALRATLEDAIVTKRRHQSLDPAGAQLASEGEASGTAEP